MTIPNKRVAILSPVAWRTPPRQYGAWETVAGNTEGLVARGWDVTLFATRDSMTRARLHAVVDRGYEEDPSIDPKVAEYLHISETFEHAAEFDLIHSHYDFMALSYTRMVKTPVLTTIHGFSSPRIMPVYEKYRDGYFVSISNSDRAPGLNYVATVYNGIDLSLYPIREPAGEHLVFLGRIHPDKGVHLAIEVARFAECPIPFAVVTPLAITSRFDTKAPMDIASLLQELYEEKQKLERAIASLEELQAGHGSLPYLGSAERRGRKSMSAKERIEVSQRMKTYWAKRRKAQRG